MLIRPEYTITLFDLTSSDVYKKSVNFTFEILSININNEHPSDLLEISIFISNLRKNDDDYRRNDRNHP